jgi:adenylate kinase
MKNILFLGPPGSGKGTQASLLADYLNIPNLSSGNMLRHEVNSNSQLGKEISSYIQKGDLVPDEIIVLLIKNFLVQNATKGFILDGFPRNINQALKLEQMLDDCNKKITQLEDQFLEKLNLLDRERQLRLNKLNFIQFNDQNDDWLKEGF